jgi:hypothetical protein
MVWIKGALFGRIDESEIPDQLGLEEFRNMLEKTVQQWNRELREEGRQEGRREGRREGRQEGRLELLLKLLEIFSTDHKWIGIQYGITALLFLLFGFSA